MIGTKGDDKETKVRVTKYTKLWSDMIIIYIHKRSIMVEKNQDLVRELKMAR